MREWADLARHQATQEIEVRSKGAGHGKTAGH